MASGGNISHLYSGQNDTSNQTIIPLVDWDYLSISSCVITVCGILTNGLVLFIILKNHLTLVTPFNVYLINLLVGNLLNLLLFYPLSVIHHVSEGSWKLGNPACTLYLYGQYVLNASLGHGHLVIILNRLWAVTFPISYRTRHNRSLTTKICIVLWLYLHAVLLPGVVLDALYYRLPVDANGCQLNVEAQMIWSEFIQILTYDMPIVLIFLIYVFTAYQTLRRNSKKMGQVRPAPQGDPRNEIGMGKRFSITAALSRTNNPSTAPRSLTEGANVASSQPSKDSADQKSCLCMRCRPLSVFQQRFLVLTFMTASILICHTPQQVSDTMWFVTHSDSGSLGGPFLLLMAIPTVLDPLLFVMTLSDVQKALLDFVTPRRP